MARKRGQQQGAQRHAEGQHGDKTHRRFVEQLQEGTHAPARTEGSDVEGNQRGKADENVRAHARIPRDADGR